MTKVFFILSFATMVIFPSFAQIEPLAAEDVSAPAEELKTCTGKVANISFEERTRDYPARIQIVDERGQRLVFVVEERIPVHAKNGTTIYLRKVGHDEKIVVEYVLTKKNRKIVKSVRVVD
ncbi:MAG: hypothetical protein ABH865_05775 [Candidatus Omnitrophota bacterium]